MQFFLKRSLEFLQARKNAAVRCFFRGGCRMARSVFSLVGFVLFLFSAASLDAQPAQVKKATNRLARERSPYLLLHAHNPTDWYPWGTEAFEKAKREKKLILLSIGYSSCYWCHVMERESFNNPEVAKLLNDSFVCIKVDREERPEIDYVYMTALNVLRQSGGWPLTMFLMPDGRPLVGGTYWPREDKKFDDGQVAPGFMTILKSVRDAYKDAPADIEERAEKLAGATRRALANVGGLGIALVDLNGKLVDEVTENFREEFDPEHGGFGNLNRGFKGPKFPLPCRVDFVLRQAEKKNDAKLLKMVVKTLDEMAIGGLYDQIGGGFHRYTVERTWTVPHFEKMLYDNAQLVELYARAYRMLKTPLYRRVVEETLAYVEREMMSPEGAFYSSQDAETEEEEGRFYVWTPKELAEALPDPAQRMLVREVYSTAKVNFEKKFHILRWPKTPEAMAKDLKTTEADLMKALEPIRKTLYTVRAQRAKPLRNEIALTGWSGQMIAGYATAARELGEPKYLQTAKKAADFVLRHQRTAEGRLLRTYGSAPGQAPKAEGPGYLEDYAFLTHGLLNLHEASGEKRWLDSARELTETMIQHHGEKERGGFYLAAHDHEKLFARAKDQYDGAQPSGNSMAIRNLVRLAHLTGEERFRQLAERNFKTFAGALRAQGSDLAAMVHALDLFLETEKKR